MFEIDALDSDKCLALSKNQLIFPNKILAKFYFIQLLEASLENCTMKNIFSLLVPSFYRFATSIWISVL